MELILIACCKKKLGGGTTVYGGSASESYLSAETYARLVRARRDLGKLQGLLPGPDLGASAASDGIHYRPAYVRYAGRVYSRGRVKELYPRARGKKIIIVSALYGVVDANDPIRCYEARMDRRISNWWKQHALGRIVEQCVLTLRPLRVHDLLSKPYRSALAPWPPRSFEAGITYMPYDYPGERTGSLWRRGDDLTRLLSGVCD